MSLLEAGLVVLAGVAAGTINTVVGSGTLITFPTLLAFGVPPVTANVSNAIGLVPGSVSGAVGYRRELAGQRARVWRLASATFVGAVAGALLLLVLPARAFEAIVPVLIVLGVVQRHRQRHCRRPVPGGHHADFAGQSHHGRVPQRQARRHAGLVHGGSHGGGRRRGRLDDPHRSVARPPHATAAVVRALLNPVPRPY